MGIYVGDGTVQDYSAMQGPAPSGFHVPSKDERITLCGILTTTFSLPANATTMGTYLKMPMAGYRSYDDADFYDAGSLGLYWSSTTGDADYAYFWGGDLSDIRTLDVYYRTFGFSIRCFKDVSVIPTSSWTTLYDGSSIATGAGVFYNATDGLISVSSDGQTWYTIMDKNLGATTVYNQGDTETDANCGYFYQRGNNYGFPHSGTVTTSTTQVDASSYGPGNYYNSSTFILWEGDWSSVQNTNLRGGETGVVETGNISEIYVGEGMDSYEAMRGPCPEGFHVPKNSEFSSLRTAMNSLGITTSNGNCCKTYLKMPFSGIRNSGGTAANLGSSSGYWTCDEAYGNGYSYYWLISSSMFTKVGNARNYGYLVRPFKDTPVVPSGTWTTLYAGTGNAGIFHNATDGLISISSDGETRITIADKNVGATTVYNDGDTLSEANCGNFFQRGNNYGFPRTGSVTTSATSIDLTNYGPGNYYSSSTFITASPLDSSNNKDLRGGETGTTKKGNVIEVYVGTTKIRPV